MVLLFGGKEKYSITLVQFSLIGVYAVHFVIRLLIRNEEMELVMDAAFALIYSYGFSLYISAPEKYDSEFIGLVKAICIGGILFIIYGIRSAKLFDIAWIPFASVSLLVILVVKLLRSDYIKTSLFPALFSALIILPWMLRCLVIAFPQDNFFFPYRTFCKTEDVVDALSGIIFAVTIVIFIRDSAGKLFERGHTLLHEQN